MPLKQSNLLTRMPVLLAALVILFAVLGSQLSAVLLHQSYEPISREAFAVVTRLLVSLAMIICLFKYGLADISGLITPYRKWHPKWWLASLPLFSLVIINLFNVEWHELVWNASQVPFWIIENAAIGLFEEVMMRGLVFAILLHAWRHKQNGLYLAAITQALIFGALHLLNLFMGFSVAVFAQVIYASFLGIAFAGVVIFSRTIWPAVVIHALIDLVGNIDSTFVPNYAPTPSSLATYALLISIIFVCMTLPGLWSLKLAKHSFKQEHK